MVNNFQNGSLSTYFGIPMMYGIDFVHGNSNVYNAAIFSHNIGLGVTRDPELVKKIEVATALDSLKFEQSTLSMPLLLRNNIRNLLAILRNFEMVSGLKLNLSKSSLMGIGVAQEDIDNMADSFNCKSESLPVNYLGLPLGANMRSLKNWKPVIEKFESRLSTWKSKCLSFGGRLTLVKSVLGSLPIYYFSIFRVPSTVLKTLESIRRKFFWGSFTKNKMSWAKWESIFSPKEHGGLGIGSLKSFNLALLGKWWWRFHIEKESLWVQVISSLYGAHGNLEPRNETPTGGNHFTTWNDIRIAGWKINSLGLDFGSSFKKSIGDGSETFFWTDRWANNQILAKEFPRLYHLCSIYNNNCKISDCGFWNDREWCWKWIWEDHVRGRSRDELVRLKEIVEEVTISREKRDSWIWTFDPTNGFSVRKLRLLMEENFSANLPHTSPTAWSSLVPKKILVHIWRIRHNGIPVRAEIDKRGIELDSVLCPMCRNEVEDLKHCFINCQRVCMVWQNVFA